MTHYFIKNAIRDLNGYSTENGYIYEPIIEKVVDRLNYIDDYSKGDEDLEEEGNLSVSIDAIIDAIQTIERELNNLQTY